MTRRWGFKVQIRFRREKGWRFKNKFDLEEGFSREVYTSLDKFDLDKKKLIN